MGESHHEVIMTNRQTLEVSGVIGVESFDSEEFLLETDCGYLGVRGQGLHLKTLDLEQGIVAIEGQLLDVSYLDIKEERQKNFLGRIFR